MKERIHHWVEGDRFAGEILGPRAYTSVNPGLLINLQYNIKQEQVVKVI